MARQVVLQNHRVASAQGNLTVDDEDGAKGLVTSGMRFFCESKSLAKEYFVEIATGAHRAAV